jgi:hypothetical protein
LEIIFPAAEDFHPAGISAVKLDDGNVRLFTPSAAREQPTIEVLDVDLSSGKASVFATVLDPVIKSPNGIAAISENAFYFTNTQYVSRQSKLLGNLEALFGIPGGNLVYVSLLPNGTTKRVQKVAQLAFGNGIAVDNAAGKFWVVSSIKGVYEYDFEKDAPWKVRLVEFLRTAMLPDNLKLAADGKVYVAGLASPMQTFAWVENPSLQDPPSWALELLPKMEVFEGEIKDEAVKEHAVKVEEALRAVDMGNMLLRKNEWRWKTVFFDDGSFFPVMSTGSVVQGGKFVGVSVFANGVVVCDGVPVQRPKPKEVKEQVQQDIRVGDDVKEEL